MDFEFDGRKSESNREKHGIDVHAAQELWHDPRRVEIPARTLDEMRTLVIGRIGGILWSAVTTPRRNTTRIISVRRSRKEEKDLYESEDV